MSNAFDYDQTPASNNGAPPDGSPEDCAPSSVNNTMRKMMANIAGAFKCYTAGGTGDDQTVTMDPALTAYSTKVRIAFIPVADNTGACTLAVNGLTATAIKMIDGSDPYAGALDASGIAVVQYDGTNFVLLNPQRGIVQIAETASGAYQSFTSTIPIDDTIPQNTEGTELLTVSITPKSATSTLIIETAIYCGDRSAAVNALVVALFQDSTADALAASAETAPANGRVRGEIIYKMTSGTTSATTFKIRAGSGSGAALGFNGRGSREFGGIANSHIRVTEILA